MNREIGRAIRDAAIFVAVGTLIFFLIFSKGADQTSYSQELPEEIAKIEEETLQKEFYFSNIESFENLGDLIVFDAIMKRATGRAKSMLPKDAGEEDVKKTKQIYEYMLEMKPNGDRDVLLELAAAAVKYAKKYSVPLGLVVGVMQTESNFNPKALSNAGACGPMQVMWSIHNGLLAANGITKRDSLFTTDLGVAAGCLILSRYLRDERSVAGGLKRYYGELSGNYVSTTYSNWHTYELYASGILETDSRNALAKDRKYLTSLMTRTSQKKPTAQNGTGATSARTPMTIKADGIIQIKKQDGSTIVWRAK